MSQTSLHQAYEGFAPLYAVGSLDATDRERFEQHLEICRPCVDDVKSFLPVTHALLHAVPSKEVPTATTNARATPRSQSLDSSRVQTHDPPRQEKPGQRRMSAGFRLMAIVCLVVAAALGWYAARLVIVTGALRTELATAGRRADVANLDAATWRQAADRLRGQADVLSAADVTTVVLEAQPSSEGATGRVFVSPTHGTVITASNVPQLPPGRTYQVWFVTRPDPVSVGLVRVDPSGRISASLEPPSDARPIAIAITMEPEGGADAPSGDVVLLGRIDR